MVTRYHRGVWPYLPWADLVPIIPLGDMETGENDVTRRCCTAHIVSFPRWAKKGYGLWPGAVATMRWWA